MLLTSGVARESWLEIIDGSAPLLLIAPHGGRAGAAARATLHPKVNDLETAAIARELARRLDACALINSAMDRNDLDCNRLAQLTARAPWMLDLIAERVEHIADRRGRAIVLLIHGWNVIEPRVDFGLGLRERGGQLHPPAGAHVSASDEFINGPVSALATRLRDVGIAATFGMRYPGGARQNLLQLFTARHSHSDLPAVKRLAALARANAIDALQLEMSVAVRLPGPLRARGLDAVIETFRPVATNQRHGPALDAATTDGARGGRVVIRHAEPAAPPAATPGETHANGAAPGSTPIRFGVEFYDRAAGLGAIASFDLGDGGAGGRIMALFDRCHAALFTAEGRPTRHAGTITLGPLRLALDGGRGTLAFRGPAVVVADGAAYLSVENAIAGGSLDHAMTLDATLEFDRDPDLESASAAFGRLVGEIVIAGRRRRLDAVARIGASLTGLGAARFETRRTLWACCDRAAPYAAVEVCEIVTTDRDAHRTARILTPGAGWRDCAPGPIELDSAAPAAAPSRITTTLTPAAHASAPLAASVDHFMTLSRPGPDGVRIHTTLGFASFRIGAAAGSGMFESSRIAGRPAPDAGLTRKS